MHFRIFFGWTVVLILSATSCTKDDDLFQDTGSSCFDAYEWEKCQSPELQFGFQGSMDGVPVCLGPGDGRGTFINFARLTLLSTKSSSLIFGNDSLGLEPDSFVQTYVGAFEVLDSFFLDSQAAPDDWSAPLMYLHLPMPTEIELAYEYFKSRYPKGAEIPIRRDERGEEFVETIIEGMEITLGTHCSKGNRNAIGEIRSSAVIQPPDHFIRVADILDYQGANGEPGIIIELDLKIGLGVMKSPDVLLRTLEGTFRFPLTE